MTRHIAPPSPYDVFSRACVKVYYPDHALFLASLMGEVSSLGRRYKWDTGGDLAAAEKIEQEWREATEQTWSEIGQGCAGGDDCEQTIIELTVQLDNCRQQIEEYENMEITVNCNCCCDGGGGFPNPDGLPTIPVDPNDPLGTDVPDFFAPTETPPDGYDTWQDFMDDRCRAANWFVDAYIKFVQDLDIVERRLSAGELVMDVALVLLALLPGPVADWAGLVVVVKAVTFIAKSLSTTVASLENLGDWLQTSADAIEENRQELVCAAYRMSSVEYLREFWLTFFASYVDPALSTEGYSDEVVDFMRELLAPIANELAARTVNGLANQEIPEDYAPTTPCTDCDDFPGAFYTIPAVVDSFEVVGKDSNGQGELLSGGGIQLWSNVPGGNDGLGAVITFQKPPVDGSVYAGLRVRFAFVENCDEIRWYDAGGDDSIVNYDSSSQRIFDDTLKLVLVKNVAGFDASVPGHVVASSGNHKFWNCDQLALRLELKFSSIVAGDVRGAIYGLEWIVKDGETCPD